MIGKMLTKTGIIGVLVFCFLLQVDLAGGDNGIYQQNKNKSNVPMEIELNFSSTPLLNEYTALNIEIRVFKDAPNTLIEIEIPSDGFELISGNTQFHEDLSPGSTTLYQLEVIPTALGQYKIAASAVSGESDYIFGKREELYVNIGEEFSELSKSSFIPEKADNRSGATKIANFSAPPIHVPPDQKPEEGQEIFYLAAPGKGQIAVRGSWVYKDKAGVDRPLRDARVEIWDADSSGDTLLDTTFTDNSGYYISDNISNSDEEGGGQDIYVKVYSTDNRSVRVTDFSSPGSPFAGIGWQHHPDHRSRWRFWCDAPPGRYRRSGWFVGTRRAGLDAAAACFRRHSRHSHTAGLGNGCHDHRRRRAARLCTARNAPLSSGVLGHGHRRRQ